MTYLILYLLCISAAAAGAALYDKRIAGTGARRVPEATLLLLAALGGGVAELCVIAATKRSTLNSWSAYR